MLAVRAFLLRNYIAQRGTNNILTGQSLVYTSLGCDRKAKQQKVFFPPPLSPSFRNNHRRRPRAGLIKPAARIAKARRDDVV
jgi:hypothetical protein